VPEPAAEPSPPAQEAGIDFASQPVYTLDFDSTFDPLGILPKGEPAAQDAAEAAPQDPEPPHGDVLGHAVEASAGADVHVDVDLPPLDAEEPEPQPQPQDPEPPHGDVLAHAGDTATFVPANRVEPRLAPDDSALTAPEPVPELPGLPAAAVDKPVSAEAPPPVSFAPPGRVEPSFDLPVDEELVALPLPGHAADVDIEPDGVARETAVTETAPASGDDAAPPSGLPLRASAGAEPQEPTQAAAAVPAPRSVRAKAVDARTRRTKLTPTKIEAPKLRVPETDEPEFVKRSRKQEQSGRTRRILMGIGAAVLLLVLASQLVLNFRNVLAARYPGARPALDAACVLLGCRVELPAQIDNLAIENGELTTLGPDTYSLNTLLRNQGSLVQAWPSIELELTDTNDKPVLRRVFAPGEYLPEGAPATGFAARSEQPVKLHFALADLKPSGYHIFIFYP
jgi:hypothetical protein